jgi:hypothetical protein
MRLIGFGNGVRAVGQAAWVVELGQVVFLGAWMVLCRHRNWETAVCLRSHNGTHRSHHGDAVCRALTSPGLSILVFRTVEIEGVESLTMRLLFANRSK